MFMLCCEHQYSMCSGVWPLLAGHQLEFLFLCSQIHATGDTSVPLHKRHLAVLVPGHTLSL